MLHAALAFLITEAEILQYFALTMFFFSRGTCCQINRDIVLI